MQNLRWGLGALVILAAGCQSNTGVSPPLPTHASPPAEPAPAPEETRLLPAGFGGPLFQPGLVLPVLPGAQLLIPVMVRGGDFTNGGQDAGLSILVKTNAPPEVLSVPPRVFVANREEPGLVEVRALEGASSSASRETYRLWLEEDPAEVWAPGWGLGLDERPLHIAVAEAAPPPAPCEHLELTGRVARGASDGGVRASRTFGAIADDFRSGEITLRSDHRETSLTLLSRYQMPYADLDPESDRARVHYHLYPTTFAFGLGFRETSTGFEQTMTLGWFDELRFRAEAPGCDPVDLHCDDDGRCTAGGPVYVTSAAPSRDGARSRFALSATLRPATSTEERR